MSNESAGDSAPGADTATTKIPLPRTDQPTAEVSADDFQPDVAESNDTSQTSAFPAEVANGTAPIPTSGRSGRPPSDYGADPTRESLPFDIPREPAIEAAAYFVVAEALTNVAKHSGASAAWVRVNERDAPRRVVVEVRDDGHGGARLDAGGGLTGLRDRVLAVEGKLRIASPEGGPTMLVAELPCAS